MTRDRYIRLTLGSLLALGGVTMVVATAMDRDGYVSLGAAVVCLLSGVAVAYNKRQTNGNDASDS